MVQQKTAFHGVSLVVDRRWAAGHRRGGGRRRLLQVNARTAAKNIEVEVEKPLGLALGQKPGGGVVITVSPLSTSVSLLPVLVFSLLFSFVSQERFPSLYFIDHKEFMTVKFQRIKQKKALKANRTTTRTHFDYFGSPSSLHSCDEEHANIGHTRIRKQMTNRLPLTKEKTGLVQDFTSLSQIIPSK